MIVPMYLYDLNDWRIQLLSIELPTSCVCRWQRRTSMVADTQARYSFFEMIQRWHWSLSRMVRLDSPSRFDCDAATGWSHLACVSVPVISLSAVVDISLWSCWPLNLKFDWVTSSDSSCGTRVCSRASSTSFLPLPHDVLNRVLNWMSLGSWP